MITLNYDDYICVKLAFSATQMFSIFPAPSGKFENKMCGNYSNNCHTNVLFTETSYLPRAWGCFPLQMKSRVTNSRGSGSQNQRQRRQRIWALKPAAVFAEDTANLRARGCQKGRDGDLGKRGASVLYHHNKWPLELLPSSQNQREWMESNFPILGKVCEGLVAALEVG